MDAVDCYCTNARRTAQLMTAVYDRALAPHGLKVTQFSLLRAVARHPGSSLSQLAAVTGLDRSTLGRNLRVAQAEGWVDLARGVDQRESVVSLTTAGRRTIAQAEGAWRAAQQAMQHALGADAARLRDLERRVIERITPLAGVETSG